MAKEPLIFATIVRNLSIKNGIASFVLKLEAIEVLIKLGETIIGVLHNLILSTVKEPLHLTLQPFPSIQTTTGPWRSYNTFKLLVYERLQQMLLTSLENCQPSTMVSAIATQQVNAP